MIVQKSLETCFSLSGRRLDAMKLEVVLHPTDFFAVKKIETFIDFQFLK